MFNEHECVTLLVQIIENIPVKFILISSKKKTDIITIQCTRLKVYIIVSYDYKKTLMMYILFGKQIEIGILFLNTVHIKYINIYFNLFRNK